MSHTIILELCVTCWLLFPRPTPRFCWFFCFCLLFLWWLLLVHCNNNFQDAPRFQPPFCACLMTGSTSAVLVSRCNDLADVTWCMQLHFKSPMWSAPYAQAENRECMSNMAAVCTKSNTFRENFNLKPSTEIFLEKLFRNCVRGMRSELLLGLRTRIQRT